MTGHNMDVEPAAKKPCLSLDNEKKLLDEKRRGMVCRDFLRNRCKRGNSCKFQHPDGQRKDVHLFCHDFQNGECHRNSMCKFIHSSHEDELHYKDTGELPSHLSEWEFSMCSDENSVPVCRQYLWGKCRSKNCRYKHVNNQNNFVSGPVVIDQQVNGNVCRSQQFQQTRDTDITVNNCINSYCDIGRNNVRLGCVDERFTEESDMNKATILYDNGNRFLSRPERETKRTYMMLEEENIMLRERVSELNKRVEDLQVTNEFLLEQNAQLRMRDKNTTGLTTVTVPAVTITNTMQGASQMQQAPTPQQMVNAAIRTVTASVATVPVSLATVTPVSIAAVSMAPVQIPPPVVTMAHPPAHPTDAQVPLPMSISAQTAPLVSYPIVSHTVIQQPPDLRH